jgi:HD-GYP domain-containing protein (c-di-GMP phosphodiesterase class II)
MHERSLPLFAVVAALATIPGAVLEWSRHETLVTGPYTHFALVAAGALAAAVASVVLSLAGARRHDGRIVLLGTAFSTMTALLAVHGLATPGVLAGPNAVVALAGAASLPAGALVLALSALPGLRRPRRIRLLLAAQSTLVVAILGLGVSALVFPALLPTAPGTGTSQAYTLLVVGTALLSVIALRAFGTWQLTRRPVELLVVVGVVWLGLALLVQMTVPFTQLGFYFGHGLELAGVLALGVPAALDLRGTAAANAMVGDLAGTDLVAQEEAFLGGRVRALVVRLQEKDADTEGHIRRVAMLSVQVGQALGLSRPRLRALALGGLLHDMGKLSLPIAVLAKPGPLDDSEQAAIRSHPEAGERLLRELGGFSAGVLALVLDHHERLDGSGYPRGLTGDAMALETRILAVCDVYDALVSDRVYRPAWTQERALALLRDPIQFDPACVGALAGLVAPSFTLELGRPAPLRMPTT